ncbi:MAG: hypothetical protein JXQ71_16860, partial [Verrucomicrobia bacterium]|nr:hypothetical protein [Verrucomicrobiota bacterium]
MKTDTHHPPKTILLMMLGLTTVFVVPAVTFGQHTCDFPPSWVARFEAFAGTTADETANAILGPATALIPDDAGNLFVTCRSYSAPTYDPAATVLKLDRNGRLQWISGLDSTPPFADARYSAMTLDREGNVIVAGDSYCEDHQVYTTAKYAPDGTQLWAERFTNSCGYAGNTAIYSVGTDEDGNVYVSGCVGVVKYSAAGDLLWKSCGRYDRALLRVLPNDRGYYLASLTPGTPSALGAARFDTNGAVLWGTNLTFGPGITHEDLNGTGIAVDHENNLLLAVSSAQPGVPASVDIVAVKFSLNGTHLWTRRYGAVNRNEYANDFAVDKSGNLIVVGAFWNSSTPPQTTSDRSGLDMLVLRYGSNGDFLWAATYGAFASFQDLANSVTTDHEGNIYVMGVSQTTNDVSIPLKSVVLKYSPDGSLLWRMRRNDYPWFLAANSAGDLFAVGTKAFFPQFSSTELLAMKLGQVEPRVAVCTGLEEGTFYGVLV